MLERKIIAVLPALNEEESIAGVIVGLKRYVDEIIVVDDASNDNTAYIAARDGAIVVRHGDNQGYDRSLDHGFSLAAKRGATIILTFDSDGQHAADDIPKVIEPILKDEADVVIGKRPRQSRFSEHIFSFIARLKIGIDDPLCGLKAYHINVYNGIGYFDRISSIGTELLFNAKQKGYRITQRDIKLNERKSSTRFGSGFAANWSILRALLRVIF